MTPLTIYKASAGSGKTFTLAVEYIAMLVRNPQSYRNILAVTFTNKATEEMKQRILSQLYGVSKSLPNSNGYLEKLVEKTGMKPEEIRHNCGVALRYILHHYTQFRVQTIDTFFQAVLRNLAHELQMAASYRVELDGKMAEQHAVDLLIEELESNKKLKGWIMDFIFSRMDENGSWNVVDEVKSFGEIILQDFYKEVRRELNGVVGDEQFFDAYTKSLYACQQDAMNKAVAMVKEFNDTCKEHGLTEQDFFQKKSGMPGYFRKMANGELDSAALLNSYVRKALEGPDGWFSAKSPYRHLAEEVFLPMIERFEKERRQLVVNIKTSRLILKNLSKLRLLESIDQRVQQMNDERGQMLLNDTQHVLGEIIGDSDTPFIYERIGAFLEHIMIDEFQDTSRLQWKNFKVLLNQCLDQTNDVGGNLIVGDVKQSIYRWRSGDWTLLNNLKETEFGHREEMVHEDSLKTNFRSAANIINFNNAFFEAAVKVEADLYGEKWGERTEQLKKAYSDVAQIVPKGKKAEGLVHIELFAAKGKDEIMEQEVERVYNTICELKSKGVADKDIAILGRRNKQLSEMAQKLLEKDSSLKLVSDEAFMLSSSLAVQLIVSAMRYVRNPLPINLTTVLHCYVSMNRGSIDQSVYAQEGAENMLPFNLRESYAELSTMPIYDMAEELSMRLGVSGVEDQSAFVCAFFDTLSAFAADGMSDLDQFLDAWDKSLSLTSIQSDAVDGIRMLTIHKSKGLEFDNLIVPFCDWEISPHKNDMIWVMPKGELFSQLPVVPVSLNESSMIETTVEEQFYDEQLQMHVDNINLLYVAFTRAGHNLFVFGRRQKAGSKTVLRSLVFEAALKQVEGKLEEVDEELYFDYGSLYIPEPKEAKDEEELNVFEQLPANVQISTATYPMQVVFRQSNLSDEFVRGDSELSDEEAQSRSYRDHGVLLHSVLERMATAADLDKVLVEMEQEGLLADKEEKERINQLFADRMQKAQVADWFSGRWRLYRECNIVWSDSEGVHECRPDRVMMSEDGSETIVVDYKFGVPTTPRMSEYQDQLHKYVERLTQMGHKDVNAYLWFVYPNAVVDMV